jgi:hypothetical protein
MVMLDVDMGEVAGGDLTHPNSPRGIMWAARTPKRHLRRTPTHVIDLYSGGLWQRTSLPERGSVIRQRSQ